MINCLLLQPPALIPSEPPLSLAILAAALRKADVDVAVLDANIDAYHYLLADERLTTLAGDNPATSVRRALKHRQQSLDLLCSPAVEASFARYSTAVRYLNLLLRLWSKNNGDERLTLGDYQHNGYSIFNPDDLELFSSGSAQTLFHPYFQNQLLPQIAALQPQRVAISINYLHQVIPAFELAGLLRQQFPDLELIAGGGLITSWQESLPRLDLKLSPFDRLVFGPGEVSLVALAKGSAPADYYLRAISEIGFVPDFSFAKFDRYFTPQPTLPVSPSRGCYWQKCLFCPEATAPVHPYGSFDPLEFPDLLVDLSRRYGVKNFHLTDNAIPVNILKKMAERRADLNGLSWFGFVRFEAALAEFQFIQQLADSGCRMLQLGLESGSQVVLDRLGKGIKLATAEKILDNLHRAGISSYVYIMLGTPGETEADAEMTLEFLEQHAEKIGFLNISIMNLPRGSELLENPELYGIDSSQLRDVKSPLGLYHEFQSATGWDRAAARRFLNQRLLGSPVIKAIVKRNPPLFSSSHAVFFS
ncbi:MAG: B12-binding domain-containing radical SAM protein [Desulfuromonadales bacterium]|nr:B12-binding domain-containing radical SAM protein [Desulfuromonadales bacterium]